MNQRKINSIRSKLTRLARNGCANYNNGTCPIQRCGKCIVAIETDTLPGNVCPYFMQSVLPANPELHAEYQQYLPKDKRDLDELKPCDKCGDKFKGGSNRAKYCRHCRATVKRDQTVKSNRRRSGS